MNREHEADQFRLERVQGLATRLNSDFGDQQLRNLEILAMHDEEFRQRAAAMSKLLTELEMKVAQVDLDNDHIKDNLQDAANGSGKVQLTLDALDEQVQELTT